MHDDEETEFSRAAACRIDASTPLHIGKLTEEAKFTLTPQMHDLASERARSAGCNPSDLYRDALFLVLTGMTYSDHVANDRRAALGMEVRQLGDKGASK